MPQAIASRKDLPICEDVAEQTSVSHSYVQLSSASVVHVLEVVDLKPKPFLEVLLMLSW